MKGVKTNYPIDSLIGIKSYENKISNHLEGLMENSVVWKDPIFRMRRWREYWDKNLRKENFSLIKHEFHCAVSIIK